MPLAGKKATSGSGTGAAAFALGRAFAAGVVLATGLVHMLPAAMHALSVSCWSCSSGHVPVASLWVFILQMGAANSVTQARISAPMSSGYCTTSRLPCAAEVLQGSGPFVTLMSCW